MTRVSRLLSEHREALIILAAVAVLRLPSLDNPFYWDEAGAYISPSLELAKTGLWRALPGCHPSGFLFGHPPLLYLLHGAIYRVFGSSVVPHHAGALVFAVIGILYTFRLGTLLCNRATGACAALLLFLSPMFFAQSAMVLGDMPITSLGVASIYYLLAGRRGAYAVTATLLLLTKETALAISVAAALYWFLFREDAPRLKAARAADFIMHLIPLATLAAVFAIEYATTGTWVQNPWFKSYPLWSFDLSHPQALLQVLRQAKWVGKVIFWSEGRVVLSGLVLIALALKPRRVWKRPFILFALVVAFFWAAFSLILFLPRYAMPVLPFLCIIGAWSAHVVARERVAWQWTIVGLTAAVFVSYFFRGSTSGNYETNLQHERVIAATRDACRYVEANHAGSLIAAEWPISRYLAVPEYGYVRVPMTNVIEIGALRGTPAVFVSSSLHPSRESTRLRQQTAENGLRLEKRFVEKEIVVEVFSR